MSSAAEALRRDPHFRWLLEGWLSEFPLAVHRRGGRKLAGDFTSSFRRILDDRYIRYFLEWEFTRKEDGTYTARPRKDARGQVIRHQDPSPDAWVMPVHEAMKRLRGKGAKPRLEWHWLNEIVRWRGLPCACGHADVVACVAARSRTTPEIVSTRVRALARQAARVIGYLRDASVPIEKEKDHEREQRTQAPAHPAKPEGRQGARRAALRQGQLPRGPRQLRRGPAQGGAAPARGSREDDVRGRERGHADP